MSTSTPDSTLQCPAADKENDIPVTFLLEAHASGKRRNDVQVHMTRPWQLREWELSSDEPPDHGGDDTAPQPLVIFAASLATCFMTQFRTFARAGRVDIASLTVSGRFEWVMRRGARPAQPYTAQPGSFHLDIDLVSEADLAAKQALVATAARGCFVEAVLSVPVAHRIKHDGQWVDCPLDGTPGAHEVVLRDGVPARTSSRST